MAGSSKFGRPDVQCGYCTCGPPFPLEPTTLGFARGPIIVMRADLISQDYFRDPAAEIARLRASGPVVEVRLPIFGKVWMTTTHQSADQVLKDSETFTLRNEDGGIAGLRWWMPSFIQTFANNMLAMDEPDHARLRGIVDEAFRRRAVLQM